jgi:hypothetical protein
MNTTMAPGGGCSPELNCTNRRDVGKNWYTGVAVLVFSPGASPCVCARGCHLANMHSLAMGHPPPHPCAPPPVRALFSLFCFDPAAERDLQLGMKRNIRILSGRPFGAHRQVTWQERTS